MRNGVCPAVRRLMKTSPPGSASIDSVPKYLGAKVLPGQASHRRMLAPRHGARPKIPAGDRDPNAAQNVATTRQTSRKRGGCQSRATIEARLSRLLLRRLQLQLVLTLEDRTPLLVVSHRHATFDANLDTLLWRFALTQQSTQKRHEASVFLDTFDGPKQFGVGAKWRKKWTTLAETTPSKPSE